MQAPAGNKPVTSRSKLQIFYRHALVDELLQRGDPAAEVVIDKLRFDPPVAKSAAATAINRCGP
jgi:hypothetical protein